MALVVWKLDRLGRNLADFGPSHRQTRTRRIFSTAQRSSETLNVHKFPFIEVPPSFINRLPWISPRTPRHILPAQQ
jgi:hypothetical protein